MSCTRKLIRLRLYRPNEWNAFQFNEYRRCEWNTSGYVHDRRQTDQLLVGLPRFASFLCAASSLFVARTSRASEPTAWMMLDMWALCDALWAKMFSQTSTAYSLAVVWEIVFLLWFPHKYFLIHHTRNVVYVWAGLGPFIRVTKIIERVYLEVQKQKKLMNES